MNDQPPPTASRSQRSARFFNHLHRYKNLLRRRWWVLPLGLAAGLAVQGYRVWTAPPAFASTGRMIVTIKITPQTGSGAIYTEEMVNFLGTQVVLMKDPAVLNLAYDRVRALKPNLREVPVTLQVSPSPKTTIFNLQATGAEPEFTRAYLEACMVEYLNLKKKLRDNPTDTTLAGFMEQLTSLERDLKKYETEEISFKASNNVVFFEELGKGTESYIAQLDRRLDGLKMEYQLLNLLSLEQNLTRSQNKDPLPPTGEAKDQASTPVNLLHSDYLREKQQLQLKQAELKEWSDILRPKHPRMIALNEDIARKEKLVEIFKAQGKEQIASQRDSTALQITNLQNAIMEGKIKSLDISKKMAEYDRIRATRKRAQDLYDRLSLAMNSVGAEKDLGPGSVDILTHATPAVSARANPVKALVLGAVAGLLAALGILVLVERLDDRLGSFTDLQDVFDEPVLGQIPLEAGKNRKGVVQLLQPDDERHAFLEAYRNLRSSLLYMANEGKRPRTIVVTSAIPGDGKSMTAANFATILALSGSRVLLVDGDLRKGYLHRHFGLDSTPGLNEVLLDQVEWRQAVQPTPTVNLSLLPHGNIARNPGEMFLSAASLKLIKELSAEFDYVIYDTAPVMAADDVTSLSPHVEGVIFVIRAGYTSGRVARAAIDLLYQREVSVLGLVFNGVETNASEYYYYRYKDYYADGKRA